MDEDGVQGVEAGDSQEDVEGAKSGGGASRLVSL